MIGDSDDSGHPLNTVDENSFHIGRFTFSRHLMSDPAPGGVGSTATWLATDTTIFCTQTRGGL
jgi:hypothetical protein